MCRALGVALAAASVVACGPSYKKLKLDDIDNIEVIVDDPDQRFCAYRPVALRALVTYKDGKQVRSRVPGEKQRGRLRPSEFEWGTNFGAINSQMVLLLPPDPLAWFREPIRVSARVIARPELAGESTLHPRFDCGGTLDLRGAPGARGGEGEDGGPGETGPEVHVALGYVQPAGGDRLVLVRVRRGGDEPEHFILDTRGARAPFVIDARGGAGGQGGQGVPGVAGTPGIDGRDGAPGVECSDGAPGEDGTAGGPGGPGSPGANGGSGGRGGTVLVRYDARFSELPDQIQVRVDGGEAGKAGPGGTGGPGGRGGKGGRGGAGGAIDPDCAGADGAAGRDGANGPNGEPGPPGQPGRPGAEGEVSTSAADVAELFAEEMRRGIPVVTGEVGSSR